jgi:hypothetical protein
MARAVDRAILTTPCAASAASTASPYSALWRLRYRKPKDIWASVYVKLQAAYLAACERQKRKLAHETAISKALLGPDDPVVLQAEAFLQADMEAD